MGATWPKGMSIVHLLHLYRPHRRDVVRHIIGWHPFLAGCFAGIGAGPDRADGPVHGWESLGTGHR